MLSKYNILFFRTLVCFNSWVNKIFPKSIILAILRFIALAAIMATVIVICLIILGTFFDLDKCRNKVQYPAVEFSGLISAYCTICFAYGGHPAFPTVQHDMKRPEKFATSALVSYASKKIGKNSSKIGFYGDFLNSSFHPVYPDANFRLQCLRAYDPWNDRDEHKHKMDPWRHHGSDHQSRGVCFLYHDEPGFPGSWTCFENTRWYITRTIIWKVNKLAFSRIFLGAYFDQNVPDFASSVYNTELAWF